MVKITQLLCSQRHCVVGVAYEAGTMTFEAAEKELREMAKRTPLNPWCAICGSTELHGEEGTTAFKTLKEAALPLLACQAEQIATRLALEAKGMIDNERKRN